MPYQIYVREGRRIDGARTLTEADVNPFIAGDGMRPPLQADVIAIGDWTFESQGCADEAPPGYKYPDGYLINRATRSPYQIPYGCLLPHEVENLLVCGAVSATHIAWGAVRCEAARIQIGIAAGVAAALALQTGLRAGRGAGRRHPARDLIARERQAHLLRRRRDRRIRISRRSNGRPFGPSFLRILIGASSRTTRRRGTTSSRPPCSAWACRSA